MKKFLAAVLAPFNVMVRECGWCPKKRILGFVRGGKGITTGMCAKCNRALEEGTWNNNRNKKGGKR
jgi:hypothetical protein